MVRVVLDQEAQKETREAASFYEDSHSGLGKEFLQAVEMASTQISLHPRLWRRIKGRFRRYLIPRFPYGLIYCLYQDHIYVAAVMHMKRKPGYWAERIKTGTKAQTP